MTSDVHQKAFIEEASELLADLEQTLLILEDNREDKELISKVFRALHTIKGSSGMFGFDEMAHFTHDIENVFDLIRNGDLPVTKEIIDLTLSAKDQLCIMLYQRSSGHKPDENITSGILNKSKKIINDYKSSVNQQTEEVIIHQAVKPINKNGGMKTYNILFKPALNIFMGGTNPLLLISELGDLGTIKINASDDEVPSIDDMNPELCYVSWNITLTTDRGLDAINDVFIFLDEDSTLQISEIENAGSEKQTINSNETAAAVKEIINEPNPVENALKHEKPAIKNECPNNTTSNSVVKNKESRESRHEMENAASLRVSTEKLDELVNLVSELVTIQARLGQIASQSGNSTVISISEEVERITWALRDSALNIRMLPIGTTFSKFKRLVRDLSNDLGKEVELKTEGAETELDKTVLEKLNDPLVHIIRNSIDHGIETPAERSTNGKPGLGTIKLSASQSGGNVLIKINDDGAGIDKEKIKAKAIAGKLIPANAELTDSEIYSLIFVPGFSTAQKVTNVSGRGVGMDVVKKAIEALRGSVEIESAINKGTTISLKLPLTLAIIDGLLVNVSDETFVIPLSSVEECIELSQKDIEDAHGRHIVNIRGSIVPYIDIRERFAIKGNIPAIRQVVIAGINGIRTGFMVDKVIGQHQTVLKTLGKSYKNVEGVSGATILGDGSIALILDISKLADKEAAEESSAITRLVNYN